jgi:hypothetical protein
MAYNLALVVKAVKGILDSLEEQTSKFETEALSEKQISKTDESAESNKQKKEVNFRNFLFYPIKSKLFQLSLQHQTSPTLHKHYIYNIKSIILN